MCVCIYIYIYIYIRIDIQLAALGNYQFLTYAIIKRSENDLMVTRKGQSQNTIDFVSMLSKFRFSYALSLT